MPESAPSTVPTYLALADQLADELAILKPGTRLPSEHHLAARESVSRDTARAALQELERRYLVRRTHGAGTFVARSIDYPVGPTTTPSWTETVRQMGATPHSEVLDMAQIDEPEDHLWTALGLPQKAPIVMVSKRGRIDGVIANITVAYLPADLAPRLANQLELGGSIYSLLVALGFQPRRDWISVGLDIVDHQTARWLELVGRPPIWHTETRLSDRLTDRPLLYSTAWSRPDVTRLRIAFHDNPSSPE